MTLLRDFHAPEGTVNNIVGLLALGILILLSGLGVSVTLAVVISP